jgi:preprotein translocase subunit SecA
MIEVHSWSDRKRRKSVVRGVEAIDTARAHLRGLSDAALASRFGALRERRGRDSATIEALALATESARRAVSLDARPCQIAAALLMQERTAVELDTGEGKTLALALAAVPLALTQGVHLVTANDYLAERDAETMGPLYALLGLSAASAGGRRDLESRRAHRSDVVYTDPRSLAFGVLRDSLRQHPLNRIVAEPGAALVDELDSVLVDAAMSPFVIAGAEGSDERLVVLARDVVDRLNGSADYVVGAGGTTVELTPEGEARVFELLAERGAPLGASLYDAESVRSLHRIQKALLAHATLRRDRDYLMTDDGRVTILDARTGRRQEDSRWRDGLHAAVEAKERVPVTGEGRRLASISVRWLFSRYRCLAGASGTLMQAADELEQRFGLQTVRVLPHRPSARVDEPTRLYVTVRQKLAATVGEIARVHAIGRPILVGAQDIEEVEAIRSALRAVGIEAHALTARHLEDEARVIQAAGRRGAVTVATQVAGRGTDIRLGDDDASADALEKLGGLYVIGSTRNAERRIDRQLRGRAGRQGQRGTTVFFASADEPHIREHAHAGELARIEAAARPEGASGADIERTLARVQRRSERRRASHRVHAGMLDEVFDEQRTAIFAIRRALFEPYEGAADPRLAARIEPRLRGLVESLVSEQSAGNNVDRLRRTVRIRIARVIGVVIGMDVLGGPPSTWSVAVHAAVARALTTLRGELLAHAHEVARDAGTDAARARSLFATLLPTDWDGSEPSLADLVTAEIVARLRGLGPALVTRHYRQHLLRALDAGWSTLEQELETLRESVGLLAYGARRPVDEVRRQAFEAFERMRGHALEVALSSMLGEETTRERVKALEEDLEGPRHPLAREDDEPPPDALADVLP